MGRSYSTNDVQSSESYRYWQGLVENTYSAPTHNNNLNFSGLK